MGILELSLITFAITLLVTKSKIFGSKREFVQKRYEASKVGGHKPGLVHRWWFAMWNCPMCLGAWIAAILCCIEPTKYVWWESTAMVFGLNWLIHCVENFMFQFGFMLQRLDITEVMKNIKNSNAVR